MELQKLYYMNELQKLYFACTQLQRTSSTLEKQNLLKEYAIIQYFTETLKFLLDPMVITGINKKKIDKDVRITYCETKSGDYNLLDLFNYVKAHNTGTDNDIAFVQWYISKLTDNEILRLFLKSIITKSLKLGIDVKTVNKVYGKNFIPKLDVMLGTSIEKCKISEGTWFSISQKLNGSRCFYYEGKLYTRQGKVYTGCEHIIEDIKKLLDVAYAFENAHDCENDYVIDGELVLKDNNLTDSEAFQKGVGIANSDKENKEELKLVIFDTIPIDDFKRGISAPTRTYKNRKSVLCEYKNLIAENNLSNIEIVPMFYEGTDQNKIWEWLDYAEENDMEGIMINTDAPYQCKRTKDLIKVKKFYTLDLKVIDAVEGDGRLKGTLGALVVDYKGNTVNVGSGFSDEQRKCFWENRDSIIGRVIEVKYKEITKNKDTGLESLQFPVFISLREQGKEISYD